ncbi:uncharacterized protein K441DRAFT_501329, partial [Cenococcum geophilum 1.58]|uniref:uncharacterized protein n=1 Tax=Cenococcum geophilum 1.58 TaxID=794803 RepID=UPI00358F9D26
STLSEELCEGLPDEFVKYFNHIKMSRDDDQGVNYKYPLRLFRSLLQHHSFKYDNIYNWTV